MKYLLGVLAVLAIVSFSATLATYVFSGVLMFLGLLFIVETVPWLKWFFSRTGSLLDILLFAFSVFMLAESGVTVSIGLSVAGLLFTVYYKPYLVNWRNRSKGEWSHE